MAEQFNQRLTPVPPPQHGFQALNLAAPILLSMNLQEGQFADTPPQNLEEEKLKAIVKYIVNSRVMSGTSGESTYCSQCATLNKAMGQAVGVPDYVPVIMMPIYSPDTCPFNLECDTEVERMKQQKKKAKPDAEDKKQQAKKDDYENDSLTRIVKQYSLQRLSDFDLLSQW